MTWETDNMFLSGPYAPWQEEGEAFDLEVTGTIPAELNGVLYRVTSSQKYRPSNPARYHWFDGDGMVHAVFIREGRASYRNKYVSTTGLQLEQAKHHSLFDSLMNGGAPFGPPPGGADGPPPERSFSPIKNPGNTNVTIFDGRLLVFSEADIPHELDNVSLLTRGMYDFHGSVSGPVTAHWKIDPDNGDLLFFGAAQTTVTWYRADRTGKLLESHAFEIPVATLLHDYTVTPDYAIFLISPAIGRTENVAAGKPLLAWDPAAVGGRTQFAVMNRHDFSVKFIDAPGPVFSTTHYHNAFQRGSTIVVDGHRVDRFGVPVDEIASYPGSASYNEWFTSMYATPWRWEIDVAAATVKDAAVTDVMGEFPKINDTLSGKEHNVGYFVSTRKRTEWFSDGMAKHNYLTGQTEVLELAGNDLIAPSEPVFVPRENATSEDDGWLMAYWWDAAHDVSELVIQDALDFTSAPVARIRLNHRVSLGFHGNWVPAAEIPGLESWS